MHAREPPFHRASDPVVLREVGGRGVDDHVLVGVDDEDRHLERAETNGTRMVEQVHERDNRLRRVVSCPEFGMPATVGMEGIFFADQESAISISKVQLVCATCGPVRIGHEVRGDRKVRVCKKCGTTLDK